MNTTATLKRIIEKAIAGGHNGGLSSTYEGKDLVNKLSRKPLETLIFDHDFCRAYWGNGAGIVEYNEDSSGFMVYGKYSGKCMNCGQIFKGKEQIEAIRFGHKECPVGHEVWQYHIQQLALSTDRIAYLAQFLEKEKDG